MNPGLIIKAFAIPAISTNIFKGVVRPVIADKSPILRRSQLGTQIFSDLQFSPADVTGTGVLIDHIPIDCVLFSVNQPKNIVTTQVAGRNGTIKEWIGDGDYKINIKGVIASGKPGVYPKLEVQNLVAFLRYKQSLGINSSFLNDVFDILEVVVVDFDIPQEEGGMSQQRFEINCISEKPVEVLISEAE